jgi:hypothetical protein
LAQKFAGGVDEPVNSGYSFENFHVRFSWLIDTA